MWKHKSKVSKMPKLFGIIVVVLQVLYQGLTVSGLSCYRCGELSSNARSIVDCSGIITIEQCTTDEACVVFKRLYVKGSESIRGCYPTNQTLPGLSGSLVPSKPDCVFIPKGRSPVKVCMCTTDLCNANDYNIHTERANQLFSKSKNNDLPDKEAVTLSVTGDVTKSLSSNRNPLNIIVLEDKGARSDTRPTPDASLTSRDSQSSKVVSKVIVEGNDERLEVLLEGDANLVSEDEDDINRRTPRQVRQGVECYTCGSLFSVDPTACDGFDRNNVTQRTTCKAGEGCLLYTWTKSATEIGSFRECFSTDFKLGRPNAPVQVTPNCQLQRTQEDPSSTIRACICTTNFCNDDRPPPSTARPRLTTSTPLNPIKSKTTTAPKTTPPRPTPNDGPIDCRWTDFSDWGNCSAPCGDEGVQTRERSIALLARRGGKPCEGDSKETRPCNRQRCPPSQFGAPQVICQTLNVLGATYANCDGQYVITNDHVDWAPERPVYRHLNKDRYIFWNAHGLGWSIGKKDYLTTGSHWHRSGLDSDEPWQGTWNGGVFVECVGKPENDEGTTGRPQQTEKANSRPNVEGPTNCVWSGFGEWSRCSVSCGLGTQQRKRMVLQQARNGGQECPGEAIETRPCSQVACPVDCEWSDFDDWTTCSASCGGGIQRRRRTVTVKASNGGLPCRGRDVESRSCNENPCGVDCRWSELSPWSKCSVTCGSGIQTRSRFIVEPAQGEGSKPCEGDQIQTRPCPDNPTCPVTTTAPTSGEESTTHFNSISSIEDADTEKSKILDDGFIAKLFDAINDVTTENVETSTQDIRSTLDVSSSINTCCDRVVVKAFGPAKNDQSLYLGTYNQITNYNGKAAYEKEGSDQLYIYFFISQKDQLSLWVVGPELGKFIAGLRNDGSEACVHDAPDVWRYASKAGVWKEDDPTLQVKCYSPEDDVDSLAFGVRKTTTKLPVNNNNNNTSKEKDNKVPNLATQSPVSQESDESEEEIQSTTSASNIDCQWSDYGPWSSCSASCDQGFQTRLRTVLRRERPGGRPCPGSAKETQPCVVQSCFNEVPTTRRPPQTTTTITTTTRAVTTTRPRPAEPRRDGRVKCFTCGSLFSTDAPDCEKFDLNDQSQQKTCDKGEACLWYSYLKSEDERVVIRECFSSSILLGTPEHPLEPQDNCSPQIVEDGGDGVMACICTDDFCNGYKDENSENESNNPAPQKPTQTTPPPRTTATSRTITPRTTTTTRRPSFQEFEPQQPARPVVPTRNSDPNRVLCHQCGTLFSGTSGNDKCNEFDETKSDQRSYCKPGEACLWYSWQKSDNEVSTIRECFSPSILLGPISNPLTVKSGCEMQDISETSGSSIFACLCDSDLCNAKETVKGDPVALPQVGEPPGRPRTTQATTVRTTTRAPQRITTTAASRRPASQIPPDDDLSPEELVALTELGRVQSSVPEEPKSRPQEGSNRPAVTQRPPQNFSPGQGGSLRCFSCGSLLDPNRKCETFNPSDATQLQTCAPNEACLLYTWKKSSTETATTRECFPTSILLGNFDDKLTPEEECIMKDISEPGTSGVTACLCTTPFCNGGDEPLTNAGPPKVQDAPTTIRSRETTTTQRTRLAQGEPTTKRTQQLQEQKREPVRLSSQKTSCPSDFELIGSSCYLFSRDRMGWIEAKKMCEIENSRLVVIETEQERDDIIEHIIENQGRQRSRFEFWTAGNDIETENVWVWSGAGNVDVPDFGWIDQPLVSAEENCLTWDITITRGTITPRGRQVSSSGQRFTEGWHSDSCCNSVRYICELP